MNIFLLRHGETEHNMKKLYYGKLDALLNEQGIKQAEIVKERLKNIRFNAVYTSEMKRAVDTAKIVLKDKKYKIIKDSRINEMDLGIFEGKSYKEIEKLYPEEWKNWCENWKEFAPPKGESFIQFYGRIKSFFEDILKLKEENILIVTHGGVIKNIYSYIMEENLDMFWKFGTKNGDLAIVKYEYGNLYLDSIVHAEK
ncbi:alpha-ribazole phosphatase [Clostridium rectalis]|uniref:alpha-ribazole phosphatase n=1 Tax=Clostridium rectalis TaxID=2040295 RepID=UPI000F634553|nr:alpha-ribazole phosphatase [Clostridium rectalis]